MRLPLLLFFSLYIATSIGQTTANDKSNTVDCSLPANCVTILNDKPIKPFTTNGDYTGKVIIQARIDTTKMRLAEHKFVFVDLHSKANPDKKIQIKSNNQFSDNRYLNALLPKLIGHLKYIKFKITVTKNCIPTKLMKFPIVIK